MRWLEAYASTRLGHGLPAHFSRMLNDPRETTENLLHLVQTDVPKICGAHRAGCQRRSDAAVHRLSAMSWSS